MKNTKVKLIPFIVLILILNSCNNNNIYDRYQKIDGEVWNNKQKLRFEFDIDDTISLHNIYLNIRHDQEYSYNNLWLFIKSIAPNGRNSIDTLECILANNKGLWLGNGLGDILDLEVLWKKNIRFPFKGTYYVEVEQAMRVDNLQGIKKIGLRIEKIKIPD